MKKTSQNLLPAPNDGNNSASPRRSRKNIPDTHLSIGVLGNNVATAWPQFFPNLQIPSTDPQQIGSDSQALLVAVDNLGRVKNDRKQNSSRLKALHKATDAAVSVLKNSLKAAYPRQDLSPIYPLYGLEPNSRGSYVLPVDNDNRGRAMALLVAKLQERGNPVASILHPLYDLNQWTQWLAEQLQLWQGAILLNEQQTESTDQIALLRPKVRTALSTVLQYLGGLYRGAELRRKKRMMGFLRETF